MFCTGLRLISSGRRTASSLLLRTSEASIQDSDVDPGASPIRHEIFAARVDVGRSGHLSEQDIGEVGRILGREGGELTSGLTFLTRVWNTFWSLIATVQ